MTRPGAVVQSLVVALVVIMVTLGALTTAVNIVNEATADVEDGEQPFSGGLGDAVREHFDGVAGGVASLPLAVPAGVSGLLGLAALVCHDYARRGQPGGDHRVE